MNKGKELLFDIIASYQDKLSKLEDTKIIVADQDIIELINNIKMDKYCLGNVTNDLIDEVIRLNKYKTHLIFIKKLYQLRDLYLGKLVYNINVDNKDDYDKTLNTFVELLNNIVNKDANVIQKDQITNRLNTLIGAIKYSEIINDHEIIELITRSYSVKNYDANMLTIMEYVAKHNVNVLKDKTLEDTINLSNELKISTLDEEVKEILEKFEINYNELSTEYKMLVKNTSVEQIKTMYELIRHNKVEDYGILHLIDRKNELAKLCILLFSSEKAVKTIVDLFRDNNGDVDVKTIKMVVNLLLPVFLEKGNDYFHSCYGDFINNYQIIKELNINIPGLLNKCPIIFTVNCDQLRNILEYFDRYKIDRKKVINKLYKVIANDIERVIDNVEVIKKYTDIEEYLNGDNYNLIKVKDLDMKINYIINKYNVTDIEDINNNLIQEVFDNRTGSLWGDENA